MRTAVETLKLIGRVLSGQCKHRNMTRPYTIAGKTCRVCTNCGARRSFDVQKVGHVRPVLLAVIHDLYQGVTVT
jgi:hypothetical protein